jgi:hypothetical protein
MDSLTRHVIPSDPGGPSVTWTRSHGPSVKHDATKLKHSDRSNVTCSRTWWTHDQIDDLRTVRPTHEQRTKPRKRKSNIPILPLISQTTAWIRQDLGEMWASLGDAIPKTWSLKPTKSLRIDHEPSSITKLGNHPKSSNRRPNSAFEESRSSTKMHKASIHDLYKQNQTQMPQNWRNKPRMKIPQNSPKKTRKSLEPREGNRRNHECFHTTRGQIHYKIMKKI